MSFPHFLLLFQPTEPNTALLPSDQPPEHSISEADRPSLFSFNQLAKTKRRADPLPVQQRLLPPALLAPVISFLLPTFQLSTSNKKGMPVSRDPEALVANLFTAESEKTESSILVLHGAADTVTDPDASRKLYEEASSTDKTIKLLEGFVHDLLFEPERDEIMKDIIDWLNCRE
ncbi:hypothetical protein POTOM_050216 [Populus tomentosa]|uniref:Serine aminopeptidase S33 domain-containing protein n=1 Tax=Populus tomentosa TaxID=118781 RepID=A0A8X7YBT5_POPTO|nr:hypothetical protein POTOM_050216 [Populus tomentosa]